jgi:branched-chain amino acid transport system ATP-binding protein
MTTTNGHGPPLLEVRGLHAGYGASQVLDDVSFSMGAEAVGIVGRNGMGKTTLCSTLMGLVKPSAGEVWLRGERIDGQAPERVARHGISYVPQGRRLFPSLTVDEHLAMLAKGTRGRRWTPDAIYDLFPRLAERKRNSGAALSGGGGAH